MNARMNTWSWAKRIACGWVLWWLVVGSGGLWASPARAEATLRIQLHWVHQAQFAGFYMAQDRGLFEREGLRVELIPGGPGINPAKLVQDGKVDVAVAWMSEVWNQSRSGAGLTQIAQLAQVSSLGLLCRTKAGIVEIGDIANQTVGFWGLGDDSLVRNMARSRGVDPQSIRFQTQQPNAKDLIEGKFACITAMAYNEKLLAEAAGLTTRETLWVVPEAVGMSHLEDGLYVRRDRLASREFQDQMVRLVRALRGGWAQARSAPSLALDYTAKRVGTADAEHQRQMLEATLSTMPVDRPFGLLSLKQWDSQVQRQVQELALPARESQELWTHQIINELTQRDGKQRFLLPSTHHYLTEIEQSWLVRAIFIFAMVAFGLSGFLVAVQAGYGPWGQLVLALVTPLGGGLVRDLLVSGDRWPLFILKDPSLPIVIVAASLCITVLMRFQPRLRKGEWVARFIYPAQLTAVPVVALTGVIVALGANLHWVWALVCAAVSVAGGGIIRDLLMNKEPASLRPGVGIEAAAAAGAGTLVFGLYWANYFENTRVPVYLSMAACVVVSVAMVRWSKREARRQSAPVSDPQHGNSPHA